jgi:hypothetical protein
VPGHGDLLIPGNQKLQRSCAIEGALSGVTTTRLGAFPECGSVERPVVRSSMFCQRLMEGSASIRTNLRSWSPAIRRLIMDSTNKKHCRDQGVSS